MMAYDKHHNSGSHTTLTETLSVLPNVRERVVFNYYLSKEEDESFGITIVGGLETLCGGIYIKTISSFGICGLDGNLKVGDQVLELNGHSMINVTHEEAIDIFLTCRKDIHIVVGRMLESKQQDGEYQISPYHEKIIKCYDGFCEDEPLILEHKPLL